ncbi:hypothetical protein HJC23_000707 [Cyclotella cryptica]|uniref:Uncharacterized protein n=1 Tax=Cyclotella cryptica TaxID=29204 RepID=A0ABD3QAF5_9STRA
MKRSMTETASELSAHASGMSRSSSGSSSISQDDDMIKLGEEDLDSVQEIDSEETSFDQLAFEIDDEVIASAIASKNGTTETDVGTRRHSQRRLSRDNGNANLTKHKRKDFPSIITKDTTHVLCVEKEIANVDEVLYRVCPCVFAIWLSLIAISYWLAPKESIAWLEGTERNAALLELSVLSTAVTIRHGPIFFEMYGGTGGRSRMSGVLAGGITVQFVAVFTMIWMVSFPVPVMIDPVFQSRVHLLRWCEWTPLAGFMTLIVFSIDAPNVKNADLSQRWRERFLVAALESVSTMCGLIFPFCHNRMVWYAIMTISFVTYSSILWSYSQRAINFTGITKGKSAEEVEMYDRSRLSLRLHWLCCVTWSSITVMYFVASASHLVVPQTYTLLHDRAFTIIEECFMDCVAKILYMSIIIEAHNSAFDEAKRATRRLNELKNTIRSVWENSSDTIAISVQTKSGGLISMVSPSFFRDALVQQENIEEISAIVLDFDRSSIKNRIDSFTNVVSRVEIGDIPRVAMRLIRKADFAGLDLHSSFASTLFDTAARLDIAEPHVMASRVLVFTDMLSRAWHTESENSVFEHDVVSPDGKEESQTYFEVKVSKSDENSIVVVIRDISERYRRFEAEKRYVYETTARQKDAEANRFTKHEIKNGLLGAIELCGIVRERMSDHYSELQRNKINLIAADSVTLKQSLAATVESISELDRALHEVLDIILAETMSNDVIHELYKPKLGRVDITHILTHMRGFSGSSEQFSLVVSPSPLPILLTDQGLFKYIHGNAIRNALKYGKPGGKITTLASYADNTGMFEMQIINLPGPGHHKLVELGSRASELVFCHGVRLHKDSGIGKRSFSAGDGAWIMHKCATILGGTVDINFEPERTVFSFRAPMRPSDTLQEDKTFVIQSGVWAIGIDDSKIQRKLLRRFFINAGVHEHHQIILGRNAEEISNFVQFVVDFVKSHPSDLFFIIADENLDIGGDFSASHYETVSGSKCIQMIRYALKPEEERRVLALVRSANDSLRDIDLYSSRAHGYMPKVALCAMNVKEMISPLWTKRFPDEQAQSVEMHDNETEDGKHCRRPSIENLRDQTLISSVELLAAMEEIDVICVLGREKLEDRWQVLWDKLHQLRGDLLSANTDGKFTDSIHLIEEMKSVRTPSDIISRWLKVRTKVASLVS